MKTGRIVGTPSHVRDVTLLGMRWLEVFPRTPRDVWDLKQVNGLTFGETAPRDTQSPLLVPVGEAERLGWVEGMG